MFLADLYYSVLEPHSLTLSPLRNQCFSLGFNTGTGLPYRVHFQNGYRGYGYGFQFLADRDTPHTRKREGPSRGMHGYITVG